MTKGNRGAVGVIAGTGVERLFGLEKRRLVRTRYGNATLFRDEGHRFFVLPRHGPAGSLAPHRVNYRANVAALAKVGVSRVIATNAVGSMNPRLSPGGIGLLGQFIDFTRGRTRSFSDGRASHVDMTHPYSERLNRAISAAGREMELEVQGDLVYVCVEGPRFETAAEIEMFRRLGGDVVGMTGVPEVVLAREAGLEYSSIVVATNWAAGMAGGVSHEGVLAAMTEAGPRVKSLILGAVELLGEG